MGKKPLAIVMGRNYTSRLGMIRAAGMAGCDVIVIQTENQRSRLGTIDDKSKYVISCKHAPEPSRKVLIDTILNCKKDHVMPILLPTDDYTAATIDMYLDSLKDSFLLPNINHKQGAVVRLMDKSLQKRIASESGLNVANEWVCNWQDGAYIIPKDIVFPCFTKPQLSSQGHLKNYQKKCCNKEELEAVLSSIAPFFRGPILVEEFCEIEREYAVVGLSLKDHSFMPSVIKMDTSWHGITATGSISPISDIPEMKQLLSVFLQKTQFSGLFDVDLYESKGKLYFNELNVRFGANGFALSYSYANLPGFYIHYLLGQEQNETMPAQFSQKTFSNENILRQMYLEGLLSWKSYLSSCKGSDLYAIKHQEDRVPYTLFSLTNLILPLWRMLKWLKKTYS